MERMIQRGSSTFVLGSSVPLLIQLAVLGREGFDKSRVAEADLLKRFLAQPPKPPTRKLG
jgi:hypothetical protein